LRCKNITSSASRIWQGDTGIDRIGDFALLTASLQENKSIDGRPPMQPHVAPWSITYRKSFLWSYEDYF
jgi:hypothetical protein